MRLSREGYSALVALEPPGTMPKHSYRQSHTTDTGNWNSSHVTLETVLKLPDCKMSSDTKKNLVEKWGKSH